MPRRTLMQALERAVVRPATIRYVWSVVSVVTTE